MAIRRFHVPDLTDSRVKVTGDQARHGLKVLRLRLGDDVILIDGAGHEAFGRIVSAGRAEFEVEIIERRQDSMLDGRRLVIAVAPPKGERADWMIEKCAELGVNDLVPLRCERGQVAPGEGKLDRWRRKAVEAAKQSRRSATMQIHSLCSLPDVLNDFATSSCVLFGDAGADAPTLRATLTDAKGECDGVTLILIGPEGGFTEAERERIEQSGGRAFRLADAILRIETAAVAAAAVWCADL